ncbi:MAG TPA: hypothetical protein VFA60_10905 [Terriglobales bacterium]|nr:hypothetical protein [Terriglobales bacterium]
MKRILSVGKIRSLLRERSRVLESAGYRVSTATSAEQALLLLAAEPYEAVVIGHAVRAASRHRIAAEAKSRTPGIRVVMLHAGSISETELADAVIASDSHSHLLETLRTLEDLRAGRAARKSG